MSDMDLLKSGIETNDSFESRFGMIILAKRASIGKTQKELADMANVEQKTISRIEAGDPGVKIGTYSKVLKALDLHVTSSNEPGHLLTIG